MIQKHAYGWKPSRPSPFDQPAVPRELRIRDQVDPRPNMPSAYDQGDLGSCTANAIAAALQYDLILDNSALGGSIPSRLFIYYGERVREGTVNQDSGAYGRDGFKVLRKTGAPSESVWPYDVRRFMEKPTQEAYDEAGERRIRRYVHPGLGPRVSIDDRAQIFKQLLSNDQTIAFGFTVFESFESEWDEEGVMPVPQPGEKELGGHEVLAVGYLRDYPHHVLVRNSWGIGWGLDGYFLMPWHFIADPRFCGDWRSIYRPAYSVR